MSKIKIPRHLKSKLKDIGKKNGFSGAKDFAKHLVEKGVHRYDVQEGAKLEDQIEAIADEKGYSSSDEVVEHLLEIGLAAYDDTELSREELEKRLRGLGYIE